MGYVASELRLFVSHGSSALLRSISLIDFTKHLTDVLHAGSLLSCHNFLSSCLCFNKRSKPGRSLFRSESVTLLVDNLYAVAIAAVKSRAALQASFPNLISILGDIESETRL
jgi:hypothetical protein